MSKEEKRGLFNRTFSFRGDRESKNKFEITRSDASGGFGSGIQRTETHSPTSNISPRPTENELPSGWTEGTQDWKNSSKFEIRENEDRPIPGAAEADKSTTIHNIDNLSLFKVRVEHDFDAVDDNELSVCMGDILDVLFDRYRSQGWFEVVKGTRRGLVPVHFVSVVSKRHNGSTLSTSGTVSAPTGAAQPYFQPSNADDGQDLTPRSAKRRKRVHVMQEILSTEKLYVRDLQFIVTNYLRPIRTLGVLQPNDVQSIFRNVETLHSFHEQFIKRLEEHAGEHVTYETQIAQVFIELGQYLRLYTAYCVGQEHARECTLERLAALPAFHNFCDEQRRNTNARGLDLLSFLIKPVQRICKYPLLIRELIALTEEDHPDLAPLQKAFSDLTMVADHVNDQKRMALSIKRIAELERQLTSLPQTFQLTLPTRKYLMEGDLVRVANQARQKCRCFLFNDVIIYAKAQRKDKFVFRGLVVLDTEKTHVEQVSDKIEPHAFQVLHPDAPMAILCAQSEDDFGTWMKALKPLVANVKMSGNAIATAGEGFIASAVSTGDGDKQRELLDAMREALGVVDVDADVVTGMSNRSAGSSNNSTRDELVRRRQELADGMTGWPDELRVRVLASGADEAALLEETEAVVMERKAKKQRSLFLFGAASSAKRAFLVVATVKKSKFEYRAHALLTSESAVKVHTRNNQAHSLELIAPGGGASSTNTDKTISRTASGVLSTREGGDTMVTLLITLRNDTERDKWLHKIGAQIRA